MTVITDKLLKDQLKDRRGRPLHDLRVSVTDRCNFRCTYCMPKKTFGKGHQFLKRDDLLSFEEIVRSVKLLAPFGVRKVRLTGGEPLLRRDLPVLVAALGKIDAPIATPIDLALTTNGVLLNKPTARALADAGLRRVTVSLDSLDDATFRSIADVEAGPSDVLAGIEAARSVGLEVKVNTVIKKGVNDKDIVPLARHFHGSGITLRFIEFMDVGTTNDWRNSDVLPAREMKERIHRLMPLRCLEPNYPGEVAKRWAYCDGGGEVGFIASITQPFCSGCTRLRLSADGYLYTCLFAGSGHDLRGVLRAGKSDDEVAQFIAGVWRAREDRYSELRKVNTQAWNGDGQDKPLKHVKRVEMSYIGG